MDVSLFHEELNYGGRPASLPPPPPSSSRRAFEFCPKIFNQGNRRIFGLFTRFILLLSIVDSKDLEFRVKILEERNGICLQSFFFYTIILLLFSMIIDMKNLELRVKILKERKGRFEFVCNNFLCNWMNKKKFRVSLDIFAMCFTQILLDTWSFISLDSLQKKLKFWKLIYTKYNKIKTRFLWTFLIYSYIVSIFPTRI